MLPLTLIVNAFLSPTRGTVAQQPGVNPVKVGSGGEMMVNAYGLREPAIDVNCE
jgi:hypothetical protein